MSPIRFLRPIILTLLALALSATAAELLVSNGPPSTITRTSVKLAGGYQGGSKPYAFTLYYGPVDATTNSGSWANVTNAIGDDQDPHVYTNLTVTGLTPSQRYYYRWNCTTPTSNVWATASSNFWTLGAVPTSSIPYTAIPIMVDLNGDIISPANLRIATNGLSYSPRSDDTFSLGSIERTYKSLWLGSGDIFFPTNPSAERITTNVVTRWDVSNIDGDASVCGVYSNGAVAGSSPALASGGHAWATEPGIFNVYTFLTQGGTEAYRSATIQTNYASRHFKVMGVYSGQNGYTGTVLVTDLGPLTNVVVNYTNASFTVGLIQTVRSLISDTSTLADRAITNNGVTINGIPLGNGTNLIVGIETEPAFNAFTNTPDFKVRPTVNGTNVLLAGEASAQTQQVYSAQAGTVVGVQSNTIAVAVTNGGVTLVAGNDIGLSSTVLANGAAITISYVGTGGGSTGGISAATATGVAYTVVGEWASTGTASKAVQATTVTGVQSNTIANAITNFNDTIHGARGGANLHALADGSGAGFLSALQYGQVVAMVAASNAWSTAYGWGNHATNGYVTQTITNGLASEARVVAASNTLDVAISGRGYATNGQPVTLAQLPSQVLTNGALYLTPTDTRAATLPNLTEGSNWVASAGAFGIGSAGRQIATTVQGATIISNSVGRTLSILGATAMPSVLGTPALGVAFGGSGNPVANFISSVSSGFASDLIRAELYGARSSGFNFLNMRSGMTTATTNSVFVVQGDGSIGINTAPVSGYTVSVGPISTSSGQSSVMVSGSGVSPNYANFYGRRSRGTIDAPTAIQANDELVAFVGRGYDTNWTGSSAAMIMRAAQNWGSGTNSSYIDFETTASSDVIANRRRVMRINSDGSVDHSGNSISGVNAMTVSNLTALGGNVVTNGGCTINGQSVANGAALTIAGEGAVSAADCTNIARATMARFSVTYTISVTNSATFAIPLPYSSVCMDDVRAFATTVGSYSKRYALRIFRKPGPAFRRTDLVYVATNGLIYATTSTVAQAVGSITNVVADASGIVWPIDMYYQTYGGGTNDFISYTNATSTILWQCCTNQYAQPAGSLISHVEQLGGFNYWDASGGSSLYGDIILTTGWTGDVAIALDGALR